MRKSGTASRPVPWTALIWATGRAEFAGQLEGVELAAAGLHQVAHVEENERGQAERKNRRGQHELAGEVQGIEHQQDSVGLGRAGHFALEHVDGDARVLRVGTERVDAGQIDEGEVVAAHAGHQAHALLDGDAGVVGDLLAQAGEAIEKSGFAGVGRADEDDGMQRSAGRGYGGLKGRSFAAGIHRAASAKLLCVFGDFKVLGLRSAHADGFRGFNAERDFHAVDAVDRGIAGRGAAQGGDMGIGDKAHMHQVVLDGFGEIECDQDSAFADLQLTENAHPPNSWGLPKRQHP